MNKLVARVALIGLLLTYFALGMVHATHASITFDEGPHLAVGYTTLRTISVVMSEPCAMQLGSRA